MYFIKSQALSLFIYVILKFFTFTFGLAQCEQTLINLLIINGDYCMKDDPSSRSMEVGKGKQGHVPSPCPPPLTSFFVRYWR